jgi:hypothetical protein
MPRTPNWFGQLNRAALFLVFGFLCVLFGFLATITGMFPYPFFRAALLELAGHDAVGLFQSDLYVPADSSKIGVTRYDPQRAYNGYTIFTSAHTQGAFLIDMKGKVVHKWALPYSQVWNRDAAVTKPPTTGIFWDKAHLYPNGDVLAIYSCLGQRLYGCGLVKMDQYSHPEWTYLQHVHHDVTVGPDGKIYTLTQRSRPQVPPGAGDIALPTIDDSVVVLSPQGKVLKEVSVLDALAGSKYHGILALQRYMGEEGYDQDPLHVNSVTPMPASFRKTFPSAGPDTVLISSRDLDTIALLDLDSGKIVWLLHGPFARQHDAEFLANGDLMVFDDLGDTPNGRYSRVLEFQPHPFKIVWQFPGDSGEKLDSEILGSVQKLFNGNVLISDEDKGRILEVTPEKKVVWEYNNAFRQGDKKQYVPIIRWARRFAPDQLHFKLNRDD